jgi:hypothetical protein
MREHLEFYLHGYVFAACAAALWGVVHEVVKYAVKRWILRIDYK